MEYKGEKTSEIHGTPSSKITSSDVGDDSGNSSDPESQTSESPDDFLSSSRDDRQGSSKRRRTDTGIFSQEISSGKESDTESDLHPVEDWEEGIPSSRSPTRVRTYRGLIQKCSWMIANRVKMAMPQVTTILEAIKMTKQMLSFGSFILAQRAV